MDVAQLIQQIDLLEEKLENLQTGVLPDIKTFTKDFLICEEEVVKRVLVYKSPEITPVQANLMVGDCGEGFTPPNIYEFAGLTGSIPQLREKLKDELEKVWGNNSNLIRGLKEESKQIKQKFVRAFRDLFLEVKKLIGDITEAFIMIGSSIAAIAIIIVAPPWNIAEAIVHVIQIIKSLKTIILAFFKLLVHLSPLSLLVFVVKREKIRSIISAIGSVIQIILKLLNPIEIIKNSIFKILDFLKKKKPSCSRQRRRLQKRIRRFQRKKRRFERRATRRGRRKGYPDWKDRFFDPDTDHITLGGDQNYSVAEKIIRNDQDIQEDDDLEKFIDAMEGFDDVNEEIKLLEEQLANVCKKENDNNLNAPPVNGTGAPDPADEFSDQDEVEVEGENRGNFTYEVDRIEIYDEGNSFTQVQCPIIFTNPPGFTGRSAAGFVLTSQGSISSAVLTDKGAGYIQAPRAYVNCGTQSLIVPRLGGGTPIPGNPSTSTPGSTSSFTSGPTSISDTSSSDFYTDLGNLSNGFDEDLIDNLIDKILSDDLSDIGEDTQSVLNDFLTYAVKYPDGTIERGVTEEELDELKNLFTVEIRNSFENL
jgi:hypothetical protein